MPYPYTEQDGVEYISAMLSADEDEVFAFAIMAEAIKQICAYVLDKSDIIRIYAEPFAINAASCRVLEKAGFVYEGTLRNNAVKNGKVIDMKMYSLLKTEI